MAARRERPGTRSLGNAVRAGAPQRQAGAFDGLRLINLSARSLPQGVAATVSVLGRFAGSTLSLQAGALPNGMTLNSGAGTIGGTPSATGTFNFTLREVLAGKFNSPRDTALTLVIV